MASASIVFVPGSFSEPELCDGILDPLRERGYDVHGIHLRSALPKEAKPSGPPIPTMYDDAKVIADKLRELADEGKDVVIFAHSYGGTPASESLKGLSKASRQAEGKTGGVVRLAFITCLIGEVGQSAGELLATKKENKLPANMNEDGWMYYTDMQTLARIAFSGIPHDEALKWANRLGWHSSTSFGNPLQYAGYKDVPVSWLLCEEDLSIPAVYQRTAIEMIERTTGRKVDVTSLPSGHVPMVMFGEEVVEWMVRQLG
ncbi:hypothetical protein CC79DRAFT_1385942 [Sarocladium strictum]